MASDEALISFLQEDWLQKASTIIQSRLERYAQSEIRFNLMAVIRDRRDVYREQLAVLQTQQSSPGTADSMAVDSEGGREKQISSQEDVESETMRWGSAQVRMQSLQSCIGQQDLAVVQTARRVYIIMHACGLLEIPNLRHIEPNGWEMIATVDLAGHLLRIQTECLGGL